MVVVAAVAAVAVEVVVAEVAAAATATAAAVVAAAMAAVAGVVDARKVVVAVVNWRVVMIWTARTACALEVEGGVGGRWIN
jgi:hypothetical protein